LWNKIKFYLKHKQFWLFEKKIRKTRAVGPTIR